MAKYRTFMAMVGLVAICACNRADDEPKLPLGHPPVASEGASAAATPPTITGEAKVALDSGNAAYTAKDYALALGQYRRAAVLAPSEEAPLFGILMVATATNDARLSDSVTAVMRALNPQSDTGAMADSALVDIHSRVLPPSHPPLPSRTP
jgi:hypothetical protein